jgi:hypothetical protein
MHAFFRRLSFLALATIALSMQLCAQGAEDDYDFSEIPVEEEEIPYIGVGGGYQLVMTLMNLDELNARVAVPLGLPEFSGQFFMHGGGGWTAIGIIPNVRLGVFGGGGSKEVSMDSGDYHRSLRFSSGYTGALIDYAITPFSKFTIAPGVMIGGAGIALEYAQTHSDGDSATFDRLFDPPSLGGTSNNANRQMAIERNYFFWQPMLNLEYALTQFILVRAGGGYMFSTGKKTDWTDRHAVDVTQVPEGINADGVTLQLGVFIGLFQQ